MMSFLMIVLLLFGLVMPVAAQDGELPNLSCNGLSEADCELMTSASMALQTGTIQSFTMPGWAFNLNLDTGSEAIAIEANGSGRVVLPMSALAVLSDLPQTMVGPQGYDMEAVINFYESVSATMLLQALEELGLELVVDQATIELPDQSMSLNAALLFKDSALYVRLESPNEQRVWFGEELVITDEMAQELEMTLDEMVAALESPEMQDMIDQTNAMTEAMLPLVEVAGSYITTTRGDDAELHGQPTAVFTTTFDLDGFLSDPELPRAVTTMVDALVEVSGESMELGTAINEAQVEFMLMTVGMLVEETTLESAIWVGLDDRLPHRQTMDMMFNADLSLLGDPEMTQVSGAMNFAVELNEYNSTTMEDATAPIDFEPLDRVEDFLVGGPGLIERELALGETFSAGFTGDDTQDVYAVMLDAGQTVQFEVASEDYPYVTIYGPDGFAIEELDLYTEDALTVSADAAGMYLVKIEGFWELDYDITVRAQ